MCFIFWKTEAEGPAATEPPGAVEEPVDVAVGEEAVPSAEDATVVAIGDDGGT